VWNYRERKSKSKVLKEDGEIWKRKKWNRKNNIKPQKKPKQYLDQKHVAKKGKGKMSKRTNDKK